MSDRPNPLTGHWCYECQEWKFPADLLREYRGIDGYFVGYVCREHRPNLQFVYEWARP